MIPLEKWKILTPLQKLLKNVGNSGKIIVAVGFEKLPKVQLITQSGHTALLLLWQSKLESCWRICFKQTQSKLKRGFQ